jgi:hypothetical protein
MASVAGPQLFQVCQAWRMPSRRTRPDAASGRGVAVGVAVGAVVVVGDGVTVAEGARVLVGEGVAGGGDGGTGFRVMVGNGEGGIGDVAPAATGVGSGVGTNNGWDGGRRATISARTRRIKPSMLP